MSLPDPAVLLPQMAAALSAHLQQHQIADPRYLGLHTGGVWVGKFLKTCTYQRMSAEASVETAEVTERQCILENMLAHAITARVRIERYATKRE